MVYHEKDPGLGLYVVAQGVVILSGEDEQGQSQEVRRIGRHGAFGLRSLLGEFPRMETATAERDTTVVGLFRPDLRALIRHNPRLGAAAVLAVGQHLAARESAAVRTVGEREGPVAGSASCITSRPNPSSRTRFSSSIRSRDSPRAAGW